MCPLNQIDWKALDYNHLITMSANESGVVTVQLGPVVLAVLGLYLTWVVLSCVARTVAGWVN